MLRHAAELHTQWQSKVPNQTHECARGEHRQAQACMCVFHFRRNKLTNILAFQLYRFARYKNTDAGASDMRSDRTT